MKRVDKADLPTDGGDDSRPNKGFMIDADGNHVMVMPDTASWAKFEATHKASTAKKQEEAKVDEELQERGFDCPIDHVLFVVPSKTPCCSKTYCHGCIEDALVNNDLVCPNCGTENVLIDDLLPDTEVALKIKAWQDEKAAEAKAKEAAAAADLAVDTASDADKVVDSIEKGSVDGKKAGSPGVSNPTSSEDKSGEAENEAVNNRDGSAKQSKSPSPAQSATSKNSKQDESSNGSNSKKRPAEEDLKNDRIPTAPAAMRKQSEQQKTANDVDAKFLEDMQKLSQGQLAQGVNPMPFSNPMALQVPNAMMGMPNMMGMQNNMSSMPMNMPNAMSLGNMNPMMMGMPNVMGMSNPMAMQNGWSPMGQMNMPQANGNFGNFNNGTFNNGNFNNGYGNQGYGNQGWQNNQQWNNNQMGQQQHPVVQNGNFRPGFNKQAGNGEEDNAYFRQPVNPFRHQKQKRMRPSDYREL
jgi:protein MPE1